MKILFLLLLSLNLQASILPENNLEIPVSAFQEGGIDETTFNDVIEELNLLYSPIIKDLGGKLIIEKYWESKTVNAYARRFQADEWRVMFFGGMARHRLMTRDAFSLIVCHELGHHLGGAPIYGLDLPWSANEGQADYFSVAKCLRRLWIERDNTISEKIPASLIASCQQNWPHPKDQQLCLRTGMAGFTISQLFASLNWFPKYPSFETPDSSIVKYTNGGHPKPQCRLDTYLQASLCGIPFEVNPSYEDEVTGICHSRNGNKIGLRPSCWYKPLD